MNRIKINIVKLQIIAVLTFMLCFETVFVANASTALAISFGTINYELQTMQVYSNNNTVVYYSTDNSTWSELEGAYDSQSKSYTMDISWVSQTSDTTLYFKGDVNKTVKDITLPAQNSSFSADYDKVDGTFTFNNAEEADTFEWRKSTDYNWTTVDMEETSNSYNSFLNTVEKFKVMGASIIIRLPQEIGTGINDVGMPPSKEDSVTISARTAAPTIKVNSTKLTLNTTTAMEYYDSSSELWIECTGIMSLEDIAPQVLYDNGAKAATIKIRKEATTSSPYSKTAYVKIPGQDAAPKIGDSSAAVTYYYMNSKLMLQFNKASSKDIYQYTIIKSGADFDASTANWRNVSTSDVLTITNTTAPDGCTIYVRKKGTDAEDDTDLELASAVNSFTVKY